MTTSAESLNTSGQAACGHFRSRWRSPLHGWVEWISHGPLSSSRSREVDSAAAIAGNAAEAFEPAYRSDQNRIEMLKGCRDISIDLEGLSTNRNLSPIRGRLLESVEEFLCEWSSRR
jgi:hypothetical protein